VAGRRVFVCENPNLLAIAADRWGRWCAPMICTDGMPAAAQRCLLSQLAQAEARPLLPWRLRLARVHIGNYVMREYGAASWHFDATDYVAAVQTASSLPLRLDRRSIEASWDEA